MRSSLFALIFPLLALANPHHTSNARQHRRHQQRADGVSRLLERGGDRATFYDVGLGACGKTNSASEHVIALNVQQFANGAHCFDMVTISFQGKSTQAQVVDECMGCPYGGIDMSNSLFGFFSPLSAGVIQVDWSFGSGDSQPSTSAKPKPKPTPTSTSSSSTWKPPKTSSSSSSTWSSSSSSSSSVASSSSTSTNATSTTAAAPPAQTTAGPQNLADLNHLVVALGQLVLTAGQ